MATSLHSPPIAAAPAARRKAPSVPARLFRPGRLRAGVLGAAGIVLFLAAWEVCTRSGVLPADSMPPASQVLALMASLFANPALWIILGQTMLSWALGLLLAMVLGVPLGILLGANNTAYRVAAFMIEALRPIPPVILIPIVVLVLGTALPMKLFLISFGAFWVVLLQTIYGVRAVEPQLEEMSTSYRLNARDRFLRVRLPGALPTMVTGLRVAATVALIVSIVAELVGGAPGIGREILIAESHANYPLMYALIMIAGLLGLLVNAIFQLIARRILFWHPSMRKEAS